MATDFNNKMGMPQPMTVGSKTISDLPLDVRTRIETIDEMALITFPFIGMMVYVKDEDKFYVVKSLKGEELVPGMAATLVPNYRIDTYEEFSAGTSLDEKTIEALDALGVPYKEARPELPGTAVPEHYKETVGPAGTNGALEVVADDAVIFDENLHVRVSDANALAPEGVTFEVGDYVEYVEAVEGTETTPAQPEQEATGLFKIVQDMAADASVLAADINIYGIGEIGGVKDGDMFAMGSTLDDVVKQIFQKTPTVEYVQPEVILTVDPPELEQEVGTQIAPVLSATYIQNDAGVETSRTYTPVNSTTQSATYITEGENQQYQVLINYAAGEQKTDSEGNPLGTPIPAGDVIASCRYTGYRNMFFGGDTGSGTSITSDEVRALPNKVKVGEKEATFKVPLGTTRIICAYPRTLTLDSIIYVEQGSDYTDLFSSNYINVFGENNQSSAGYAIKIYNIPVALEGIMTFKVTFK